MTAVFETGLRDASLAMAAELSAALALPPQAETGGDYSPASLRCDQSLSKGAAGVAILHGLRAQQRLGGEDSLHAWLTRATRDDLSAGPGAGLWFGAPAVAFALSTSAPGTYPDAMIRLDTGVTQLVRTRLEAAHNRIDLGLRPSLNEFDLVRGLTGLGASLLHRDPDGDLFRRVLAYLVRLTEPVPAADQAGPRAPDWWTSDVPSGPPDPAFAAGHANFGMAHGIAGPLALLALAMRHGVTVPGHTDAISTICRWLDDWRHIPTTGPWWPERVTLAEFRAGYSFQDGPARPSWCYGTPGLVRAQQLAAISLADRARQLAAEAALAYCLADDAQLARITDPALCHGWAGLVATAWHVARDATTPRIADHLPRLLEALLAHAHDTSPGALPGLIEGSAGIALTLHTLATTTTSTSGGWPTCLLLS